MLGDIAAGISMPRRTLLRRLAGMVEAGLLTKADRSRAARYRIPTDTAVADRRPPPTTTTEVESPATGDAIPFSAEGARLMGAVSRPITQRDPVGYQRAFLDNYRPNESHYLTETERAHLLSVGTSQLPTQPAGTHARAILGRLLIDLSFNSSRLEGNTYSLLDTQRLIDLNEVAEGKSAVDAQMILNHKDAIEFLVGSIGEIGFDRRTILNLHAMLSNNLLPDRNAVGRLRRLGVGIAGSVYHPPEVPQLIEECFDTLLAKAAAIQDPFEQALFVMTQLPYLQPFDDVNKRVSRLAANIPLVKRNLAPLSFIDVPGDAYTRAMLAVYELNRVEPLRDVFIWAYERSAKKYAVVQQTLSQPDAFQLRYRTGLRKVIKDVVGGAMNKKSAGRRIASYAADSVPEADRARFIEVAESELLGLHEGSFARYQLTAPQFDAWQREWNKAQRKRTERKRSSRG